MISKIKAGLIAAAVLPALSACDGQSDASQPNLPPMEVDGPQALHDQSALFEKRIVKVADNVHVAIGYALANVIMIEGDDGVIIVDTTEGIEAAREVKAAFDEITLKPVKAIIYTHNHADHIFGSKAFTTETRPQIIAQKSLPDHVARIMGPVRASIARRSARQFGGLLPEGGLINAGVGPELKLGATPAAGYLAPTLLVDRQADLTIAGVRLHIFHAPGETADHLAIWLPDQKVLLPGDNIYKAFPNLYAIRGTAYRDVMDWARSLDRMKALKPDHLVPAHTIPVSGVADIASLLTHYRDAIQFTHDQTIRLMNQGLGPDEIVARLELPARLADHPWLQPLYGQFDWSVRAVFSGQLGWFSGNATDLHPLPPQDRAREMVALAGGSDPFMIKMQAAFDAEQYQWALELSDHALLMFPGNSQAIDIRSRSLEALAAREPSANGRNYYLTQALETQGLINTAALADPATGNGAEAALSRLPLPTLFAAMAVAVDGEAAANADLKFDVTFPDEKQSWRLHFRNGVGDFQLLSGKPELSPDVAITIPASLFKQLLVGLVSPADLITRDDVQITKGSVIGLSRALLMFNPG